jgi:hypothetical protein
MVSSGLYQMTLWLPGAWPPAWETLHYAMSHLRRLRHSDFEVLISSEYPPSEPYILLTHRAAQISNRRTLKSLNKCPFSDLESFFAPHRNAY